jgi:hypothetical protein
MTIAEMHADEDYGAKGLPNIYGRFLRIEETAKARSTNLRSEPQKTSKKLRVLRSTQIPRSSSHVRSTTNSSTFLTLSVVRVEYITAHSVACFPEVSQSFQGSYLTWALSSVVVLH